MALCHCVVKLKFAIKFSLVKKKKKTTRPRLLAQYSVMKLVDHHEQPGLLFEGGLFYGWLTEVAVIAQLGER